MLHHVLTLLLLLTLHRHIQHDPNLLTLEPKVQLVIPLLELEDALLDKRRELRLELLRVDPRAGLEVGVGQRVGGVELEEDAGLVGRGDEEVLLGGVEGAEPACES